MICRALGVIAIVAGAFFVYTHFAIIADPAPGEQWSVWRQYIDLLIGIPLLAIGLYCVLQRRSHGPDVRSPAA